MPGPVINLRDPLAAEKWQQILSDLVTDPKELLQILGLDPAAASLDERLLRSFPLKVPRTFLARMEKGNWQDPLLRQVFPLDAELDDGAGSGSPDPLQEADFNPLPGLLQKYRGRVLLTVAPHCAVHCRYCFRRHFDYARNTPGRDAWQRVIEHIRADSSISEVIYSGGDPLAAGDRQLAWLTEQLGAIPHLRRLRVHTRTPVVIPQRVTPALLDWLTGTRLQTTVVLHCNHAREIDAECGRAMAALAGSGLTLLNQSVLLRGVNDCLPALVDLSERLFEHRVLPYYLHLLDPVQGVRHFEVPESRALELVRAMQGLLPGYLVPRLVREEAGAPAKVRLA